MDASSTQSREVYVMSCASKETLTSDFTNKLQTAETLSSGASATQKQGPGTLVIGTPAINTGGAVTVTAGDSSHAVATGKGIQFTVDARRVTPGYYEIEVTATSSDGNVKSRTERIRVVS